MASLKVVGGIGGVFAAAAISGSCCVGTCPCPSGSARAKHMLFTRTLGAVSFDSPSPWTIGCWDKLFIRPACFMNAHSEKATVLILGGYGTFGQLMAKTLAAAGVHVIINGRRQPPAQKLRQDIESAHPGSAVKVACFDVHQQLSAELERLKPDLVIHTCGPFQAQNTRVAATIIGAGIHYLDLADSREYVARMHDLHDLAVAHQVVAITGASTVPALSSAALTWLQDTYRLQRFTRVQMGITPGQKTPRGLATTRAVLSYLGKVISPWPGSTQRRHGWMDLYRQQYPTIGTRLMGNCEAPDLDLLNRYFEIDELQFSAGMDSKLLHLLPAAVLIQARRPAAVTFGQRCVAKSWNQ